MEKNIRELTSLLESLFELSQKQREALDRQALSALESILQAKDELLEKVAAELGQLSESGILVMNPKTYPADPEMRARLSHAATQIRRFEAHEKGVTAQTKRLQGDISRRLHSLQHRRQGLAGYSRHRPNHRLPTMTG